MGSFQAKIGWKMMRKTENKKLSLRFVHARRVIENSKKISKKLKNEKNAIMGSFQAKIGWKMMRKRENKKLSLRFVPTRREIQNSNKIAEKFKTLKNTIMASFRAKNRLEKEEKETK